VKNSNDTVALDERTGDRRGGAKLEGFPPDLERRFYIIEDGNQRTVFADTKGEKELFRDKGHQLVARPGEPATVKLMVDTAQHRGWETISVGGSKDFRREAWLEASSRGLNVRGYEPTPLDLAELSKRTRREPERAGSQDNAIRQVATQEAKQEAAKQEVTPARPNYKEGIEGVVLAQGVRPYQDKADATGTAFVDLQLPNGEKHTVWGVGLPDAMEEAGVEVGDKIALKETGVENVTVGDRSLPRRSWEASRIEEYRLEREIESIGADFNYVNARESSIPNEERAKLYLDQSRAASAGMPELRNAVALESYVERKLQREYGNRPELVSRGLNEARHKIAYMIRHGTELPHVRVREERTQELSTEHREPVQDRQRGERER